MRRKLSVKTKMIIFIATSLIAIYIIAKTGIDNRKYLKSTNQNNKTEITLPSENNQK